MARVRLRRACHARRRSDGATFLLRWSTSAGWSAESRRWPSAGCSPATSASKTRCSPAFGSTDGLDLSAIAARYGVDVWARYGPDLARFVDAGLLVHEPGTGSG